MTDRSDRHDRTADLSHRRGEPDAYSSVIGSRYGEERLDTDRDRGVLFTEDDVGEEEGFNVNRPRHDESPGRFDDMV